MMEISCQSYIKHYASCTPKFNIIKSFVIFVYMLVITWMKYFKVPTVVGSIVVDGVLTGCTLLHSVCNLKASQMNVLHSLIQEIILYEFKLGHNAAEATKNICCVTKGEGADDYSKIKRLSGCKKLKDQGNVRWA